MADIATALAAALEQRKCSICHETIPPDINGWTGGHNAWPVVENGRCCGDCNATVVIPTRLGLKPLKKIPE